MSDTPHNKSVWDLEVARRVLVGQRREAAQMIASYSDGSSTNPPAIRAYGSELQQLQEQIEAVDRALADEQAIAATAASVSSPEGQPSDSGAPSPLEMLAALNRGDF